MTTLWISGGFKGDLTQIRTDALLEAVFDTLEMLEAIPTLGSTNVPTSIKEKHGSNVRKLVVGPFDVIYEYDKSDDHIKVAGLVYQRMAR